MNSNGDSDSNAQIRGGNKGGKQNQGDINNHSNSKEDVGAISSSDGTEFLGVGRAHSSERSPGRPGNTTTGGILSQSIQEAEDELAEIGQEMEKLVRKRERIQSRRERFQAMLTELQQRVQNNP